MNLKTVILSALLIAIPVGVRAQDVDTYENYQVACDAGAECDSFNVNYIESDSDKVAQTRRTRTRRTRSSGVDNKYYAGGNLGVFFPFIDDTDVGFGLSGLFGYRFTNNISAELEVLDYFGGSEIDDLGYNIFGVSANGVYRYYFDAGNFDNLYAFGGVGVGFGIGSSTGDVADDLDDAGIDTSETGFLLQGKAGIGYPLNEKVDLFGQARYLNVFVDGDDLGGFSEDFDGLSVDVGATYKF